MIYDQILPKVVNKLRLTLTNSHLLSMKKTIAKTLKVHENIIINNQRF